MSENTDEPSQRVDAASHRMRFDGFELDLETLELVRDGEPVKLQQQPCRVLALF